MGRKIETVTKEIDSSTDDITGVSIPASEGKEYTLKNGTGRDARTVTLFVSTETANALESLFDTADGTEIGQGFRDYLTPILAPAKRTRSGKAPAAANAEVDAAREFIAANKLSDQVKTWVNANGHPEIDPAKAGRIPGAYTVEFAKAHGFTYDVPTEPAPSPEAQTGE
jgi:hypothetical protein